MSRQDYLRLAERGLKMPIGVDLVLRERPDAEELLLNGKSLGEVVVAAAKRYRTDAVKAVESTGTTSGSGGSPR